MPLDARPQVAITGIGLVTGLGDYPDSTWNRIRYGDSAIRKLEGDAFIGRNGPLYGAPIRCAFRDVWGPREAGLARYLALYAADDARINDEIDDEPDRIGVAVGLSKGSVTGLTDFFSDSRLPDRTRNEHPWIGCWPGTAALSVSYTHQAYGPSLAPVAACATGLVAVLQGTELIRRGTCDIVLAGAVDASLHPLILAAFDRMGALSRVNPDFPGRSIRPWDRQRSGFQVGEGGAIFVLERLDHARNRERTPYALVAGGALGSDAYHLTDLDPNPRTLAGVIGRALSDANLAPDTIDHVNVHGTATRSNDPLECRALRMALGPAADRVSCSANKPQIGHALGAAGAVELAITCLALRDQFVPPTLNLEDPDPACDLDGTPGIGRHRPIRAALKLSLGFGGHLAAIVLTRPESAR